MYCFESRIVFFLSEIFYPKNTEFKLKMDDRVIDCVFMGSLKNLPSIKSKIVRIFTSSTFTGQSTFYLLNLFLIDYINKWKDMSLERNTLMENVYPKIKEYCKERHGLEFQGIYNS